MRMELYQEILTRELERQARQAALAANVPEIVEGKSYRALNAIKAILADDSLSDPECFAKIEEIVCVLEDLGSSGGGRHDFG